MLVKWNRNERGEMRQPFFFYPALKEGAYLEDIISLLDSYELALPVS